jgi:hypothetical protein
LSLLIRSPARENAPRATPQPGEGENLIMGLPGWFAEAPHLHWYLLLEKDPHQGIGQRIPDSAHHPPRVIAGDFRIRQIRRKPVLSGLINEYERAA